MYRLLSPAPNARARRLHRESLTESILSYRFSMVRAIRSRFGTGGAGRSRNAQSEFRKSEDSEDGTSARGQCVSERVVREGHSASASYSDMWKVAGRVQDGSASDDT